MEYGLKLEWVRTLWNITFHGSTVRITRICVKDHQIHMVEVSLVPCLQKKLAEQGNGAVSGDSVGPAI